MQLPPESLYLQLGRLVSSMPDLGKPGPVAPETNQWLGRAAALVDAALGDTSADAISLKVAANYLDSVNRDINAQTIASVVHRALAQAELRAPASAQGSFIPVGESFSAFAAVSKVLQTASVQVLIADPYADEKALTDFAVAAPEQVHIRILTDTATVKPTLKPAAERWARQYASARPLEVRLAPPKTLHDRLILVDGTDAWILTQSLKDFAARAHASIAKVESETAKLKIDAYATIWQQATAI